MIQCQRYQTFVDHCCGLLDFTDFHYAIPAVTSHSEKLAYQPVQAKNEMQSMWNNEKNHN